jgi:DNA primase
VTPGALHQAVLLICEAPIDALSLALCGYPALATCGAKNIPPWLPAACKGKRVLIAHDPDEGGEEGAELLRRALKTVGIIPERLKPDTGDWNDYLRRHGVERMTADLRQILGVLPKSTGKFPGLSMN